MEEGLRHVCLVNVFADRPEAYFNPGLSEVPGLEPDLVIYEPKPNRPRSRERTVDLIAARGWKCPIVVTGGDELAHYGPGLVEFLERLVEAVGRVPQVGAR